MSRYNSINNPNNCNFSLTGSESKKVLKTACDRQQLEAAYQQMVGPQKTSAGTHIGSGYAPNGKQQCSGGGLPYQGIE
ncbi:MAG: hypothetical protein EZS28_028073 [Streblomastix strix]|uniref:Uncharacterized protein n=1 Tax=Streblomastix strix TaxID=222440 RepID=A0A5J4V0Z6_9EUKA|nr:MAG: hypothetical protein EZS28_028073 [Streblomastix strix]